MFTIPKKNEINNIIKIILNDFNMQNKGLYDIQIGGSQTHGFIDEKSDIDLIFIVEDVNIWKKRLAYGERLNMKTKKEEWKQYWNYRQHHNIDILFLPKKDFIKVEKLLRSYSLLHNRFLYNEEYEYMPALYPGEIIQPSMVDYTLKIKPRKVKRLEQAYKDKKIFFPTKQIEQEWSELLEKRKIQYN